MIYLNKALTHLYDNSGSKFTNPVVLNEDRIIAFGDDAPIDVIVNTLNKGFSKEIPKFIESGSFIIVNRNNGSYIAIKDPKSFCGPANSVIIQVNNFFRIYELEHNVTLTINDEKIEKYYNTCNNKEALKYTLLNLKHMYFSTAIANYKYERSKQSIQAARSYLCWDSLLNNDCKILIDIALIDDSHSDSDFDLVQFNCILDTDDIDEIKRNRYITPSVCQFRGSLFLLTSYSTGYKILENVITFPGKKIKYLLNTSQIYNDYEDNQYDWINPVTKIKFRFLPHLDIIHKGLNLINCSDSDKSELYSDLYFKYVPFYKNPWKLCDHILHYVEDVKEKVLLKSLEYNLRLITEFKKRDDDYIATAKYSDIFNFIIHDMSYVPMLLDIPDDIEQQLKECYSLHEMVQEKFESLIVPNYPWLVRAYGVINYLNNESPQYVIDQVESNALLNLLYIKHAYLDIVKKNTIVHDDRFILESVYDRSTKINIIESLKKYAPHIYAAYELSKYKEIFTDPKQPDKVKVCNMVFTIVIDYYKEHPVKYDYKFYILKLFISTMYFKQIYYNVMTSNDGLTKIYTDYMYTTDEYVDIILKIMDEGVYCMMFINSFSIGCSDVNINNICGNQLVIFMYLISVLSKMNIFLTTTDILKVVKSHLTTSSSMYSYMLALQLCDAINTNPKTWYADNTMELSNYVMKPLKSVYKLINDVCPAMNVVDYNKVYSKFKLDRYIVNYYFLEDLITPTMGDIRRKNDVMKGLIPTNKLDFNKYEGVDHDIIKSVKKLDVPKLYIELHKVLDALINKHM